VIPPLELLAEWEDRLREDGLASIDGYYTVRGRTIAYTRPDNVRPRHVDNYDYVSVCVAYSLERIPAYPDVWALHCEGVSIRRIGRQLGINWHTVADRIELMRAEMMRWLKNIRPRNRSDIPDEYVSSTEVLEHVVNEQKKWRNNA